MKEEDEKSGQLNPDRRSINAGALFRPNPLLEFGIILLLLCSPFLLFPETICARYMSNRRESEARAGLHEIQVAVERYATDNKTYPPFLYGGDVHSTFTTDFSSLDPRKEGAHLNLDFSDYNGDPRAVPGDCDPLLQYGYLSRYPTNPFVRKRIEGEPLLVTDPRDATKSRVDTYRNSQAAAPRAGCSGLGNINGWQFALPRVPAGLSGNLMWDVSEGQRHPPFMVLASGERAGAYYAPPKGTGGVTVTSDMHDDTDAAGVTVNEGKSGELHPCLPGNFYYYPVFSSPANWTVFYGGCSPMTSTISGFRLALYGSHENTGQDVYDMFGDFKDGMISHYIDDLNVPEVKVYNLGGPDGRPDGVLEVVSSDVRISFVESNDCSSSDFKSYGRPLH
jgi:hypothetical protein